MFRKNRGFSVIELLVVVGIIFILAAALMPVLSKARQMAKKTRAREEIHQLEVALRMYGEDWGQYPDDEGAAGSAALITALHAEVENGPYGKWAENPLLDPWGKTYIYRYDDTVEGHSIGVAYNIYSAGPDGTYGSNDDITHW